MPEMSMQPQRRDHLRQQKVHLQLHGKSRTNRLHLRQGRWMQHLSMHPKRS